MAKFTCRTCDRRFGSLTLFDAHLGSDADLIRGALARQRGEPSQEGHKDPKGGSLVDGVWRLPGPDMADPSAARDFLAGWRGGLISMDDPYDGQPIPDGFLEEAERRREP